MSFIRADPAAVKTVAWPGHASLGTIAAFMAWLSSLKGLNVARLLPRHVFFFGLPLILGLAAHAVFNLVDTALVGKLPGDEGVAAIKITGLCDPLSTFQTILFNGPIAGAGVLIAMRLGARDEVGLRRIAMQATGFVLLLGVLMGVPGVVFARELAQIMGAGEGGQHAQLELCTQYLRVLLGGGVTGGMFLYLTTLQRAVGSVKAFMGLFVLSNILNLVLCIALIFGQGPYPEWIPAWWARLAAQCSFPRLGVVGSAWATVLARAGGVLFALFVGRGYLRSALSWLVPRGQVLWDLITIGVWKNGQVAVRGIAGGILIRVIQGVSAQDNSVVSGVFVGMKIELLLTLLAFGWGTAAQTLVATALGAGKRERADAEERIATLLAFAFGALCTLLLLAFAGEIAAWFNPDPRLVHWSETFILITAVSFVATPINVVLSQTMFARMKLRLPVILDGAVLLCVMVPLLIAFALFGAAVETLLWINALCNVALTLLYLAVRPMLKTEKHLTTALP